MRSLWFKVGDFAFTLNSNKNLKFIQRKAEVNFRLCWLRTMLRISPLPSP